MKQREQAYTDLAKTIMFQGATITNGGAPYGFSYRAGKTLADLKNAVAKGMKNGHGSTNDEISFVALYLSQVLKIGKELK